MISLLILFVVQFIVWWLVQIVLVIFFFLGKNERVVVPLHVLWFWSNFYIHIYLNGLWANKALEKQKWDKDGTLDPYIRRARMYIEGILVRSYSHGR